MKNILFLILAPVIVLPSCFLLIYGTSEDRIRTALIETGLDEPIADCMANRLADGLGYQQLWRLSSLSMFRERPATELIIGKFVDATRVYAIGKCWFWPSVRERLARCAWGGWKVFPSAGDYALAQPDLSDSILPVRSALPP